MDDLVLVAETGIADGNVTEMEERNGGDHGMKEAIWLE